ncbi:UDP-2,3-diacylglucosamine diphosphatase [bacterium]|nr:UDP-2,3-diacylglucosamine diphosphatase [candidate division CSSED10-310 bacterium]
MNETSISHAYFIGDIHLDTRRPERESAFCALMDWVRERRPDHVFLMGDLFEFWFGYSTVMFSRHLRAIMKIGQLTETGIPVTYLPGNHDFRPGPVFEDILGVRVEPGILRIRMGSHAVYIAHGDEINVSDWKYMVIRKLLRNRAIQELFRFGVPVSVAWQFGRGTSYSSRAITRERERPIPNPVFQAFIEREQVRGIDTIIHGHNHDPGIRRHNTGRGMVTIIDCGDWLGKQGHFVEYADDAFRCMTWPL